MAFPNREAGQHYRLLIVGDAGTGKTAFLKRHLTEEYEDKYEPTVDEVVRPLHIISNSGVCLRFHCLDTAGKGKNKRLKKYLNFYPHCAIIMFDVTARSTYKNVPRWLRYICRLWGKIPYVLCGNKVDIGNKQVMENQATFYQKFRKQMHVNYCEISVKSNCDLKTPFLNLVRQLISHFGFTPFDRSEVARLLQQANRGINASQGEIAGSTRPQLVEKGTRSVIEVDIAEHEPSTESQLFGLAISEYLKQQKSEFEIVQVSHYTSLERYRKDNMRVYKYWYHVNFIAKPRNAHCTDFFPKLFFAELHKLGTDQYTVAACSVLEPNDPGVTYGCGFCPPLDQFPHPAEYIAPCWTVCNTSPF